MDDPTNRTDNGDGNGAVSLTAGSTVRLVAAVLVSLILSFGLVLWGLLFIWLCFKYPDSADSFIKALVPGGMMAVTGVYLREGLRRIVDRNKDKPK